MTVLLQPCVQPQRDSNPCRHLERSGSHVHWVLIRTVVPVQGARFVQPVCSVGPNVTSKLGNSGQSRTDQSVDRLRASLGILVFSRPPRRAGAADQIAPMPAASLRTRHSSLDIRVTSTSGVAARNAPTVACSFWRVRKRIPAVEPAGVLPRDFVDLVVAAARILEFPPGELGRLGPGRIRVGVVALPGDEVDSDAVAEK